jgi:hypothetical protein
VLTLKIPDTTPLATYWLVAWADRAEDVAESDDTNNCRRSVTTVIAGLSRSVLPGRQQPASTRQTGPTVYRQRYHRKSWNDQRTSLGYALLSVIGSRKEHW